MPLRTIVFIDGQNLYHCAKDAWCPEDAPPHLKHYAFPSYDVRKIANALAAALPDRQVTECRFYTGVPSPGRSALWHGFWTAKLRTIKGQKVEVYKGRINPGGQEKGVDVSIAVDLLHATYENRFDVAIIVSADQDLAPAVALARKVALGAGRSPAFESASPFEVGKLENRGIQGTSWLRITQAMYDRCRDFNEYRPFQYR